MIKQRLARILRLADFMEKKPRKEFDFSQWAEQSKNGKPACGTTACALGWATAIPTFHKLGLRLSRPAFADHAPYPTLNGEGVFYAHTEFADFFGVSEDVFNELFYSDNSGMGGLLPNDITPKQWAKHARMIYKRELKNLEVE